MHTLESYALNSGAKISKPFILEKYFPSVLDKYITLDCDLKTDSKKYDFWQEVVDILNPILSQEKIVITQIGNKEDKIINGAYITHGQTSINQRAYLIKNALLHLGPDNESSDIASSYGRKIVSIFGNCLPSHFSPYWSKESDVSLIEPNRDTKPCYSFSEHPKTINLISPREIAAEVCKLLNLKFEYPFEYSRIGARYNEPKINYIPDWPIHNYGPLPKIPTSVRADLFLDENILAQTLRSGEFEIVTNKPLSPQLIGQFRSRIKSITYIIEEDNEPNFIRFLMNNAVSYNLISFLDEEKLNPIKLNYMDYGMLVGQKKLTKEICQQEAKGELSHYKSNKFILSQGKIFPSQPAWRRDLSVQSLNRVAELIIDDPTFWEEADNYCLMYK
tara:strand:- start:10269 stop:11438 length:1170 start_codon:yes stop_codon:yes gene_type:complete